MNNRRTSYRSYHNGQYVPYVEPVICECLKDIEVIIDKLNELIDTKGFATTGDYYLVTGGNAIPSDAKFGWNTQLINIQINQTRYGYELRLPSSISLEEEKCSINDVVNILKNADDEELFDRVRDAIYELERM